MAVARWDADNPDDLLRTNEGRPSLRVLHAYRLRYRQGRALGFSMSDSHDEAMNAARQEARAILKQLEG